MVRVNIINPSKLLDQHALAEWNEIQMLLGTIVKYPEIKSQPDNYKLGKGHINFFKNKVIYLIDRLRLLKTELEARGYNLISVQSIANFYIPKIDEENLKDWESTKEDEIIIKERLLEKHAMKPEWYTFYKKSLTIEEYRGILK